jgi:hypothetical protein
MFNKIKAFLAFAAENKITTACAVVWGLISLISGNPSSVAFLGPATSAVVLQIAAFLKDWIVLIGLLFAADGKIQDNAEEESEGAAKAAKKIKKPIKNKKP